MFDLSLVSLLPRFSSFSEGEDGIAAAILSSMSRLPSRMERRLGPESDKRTDGGRVPRALPRQRPGIGSRYGHRGGSGRLRPFGGRRARVLHRDRKRSPRTLPTGGPALPAPRRP